MSGFNKSALAFEDIREALERAIAAPKGIRILCKSRGHAIALRSRFNYYRELNRKDNMKIYESDHPLWNQSIYDRLILQIPAKGAPDSHILYIRPRAIEDLTIEEIEAEGLGK